METRKALPAPIETKDDLIAQLTIESIPFAALNARCKRSMDDDGRILDGSLAREKQDTISYLDHLLDKYNALDGVVEVVPVPGPPGPMPEAPKVKCHEDHIVDCRGAE